MALAMALAYFMPGKMMKEEELMFLLVMSLFSIVLILLITGISSGYIFELP
jgi:hypothetical protein